MLKTFVICHEVVVEHPDRVLIPPGLGSHQVGPDAAAEETFCGMSKRKLEVGKHEACVGVTSDSKRNSKTGEMRPED